MPTTATKEIRCYAKQIQFLNSKALWRAFCAGIGSGKSFVGALDLIKRSKPGRLYLVTAPTYPMLSDASFRSFLDVAQRLECVLPGDIKRSPPQQVKLRHGAEVIFRSADDPEMLRGPNLSGAWMDEASLMKREVYDIVIGRLREGGEMGWATATFTPKGKQHWTFKVFGKGEEDTDIIHASSEENPFLPAQFVRKVRAKYTAQQARQELGGLFVEGGGNHYHPDLWPRYIDTGDAYRVRTGDGRTHHVRKADCSTLLTLDWAMGKPKKGVTPDERERLGGDCTAFIVADLCCDDYMYGALFLRTCFCERVPLGYNAQRLEEYCQRYHPVVVCGDDDNLSAAMLLECQRYQIPSVRTMAIGGRNKLARSQAAMLRAERGQVFLPEFDKPWSEMLTDYLASFTGADGEPDDVADCMSILGRLADEFAPGVGNDEDDEPMLGTMGYGMGGEDGFGGV